MDRENLGRLIAAGYDDQWNIRQRGHACDDGRRFFESREVIGHRSKALRLAPQHLHDRMKIGRQLPHFADETLQRPYRGRSEDPREVSWDAWRAARQKREARADNAHPREQAPHARELNSAPEQS